MSGARDAIRAVEGALGESVLASGKAARLLVTALLADGHALIEGAPGIGKTSLAEALALACGGEFRRIQFTPDLLPSDILGYSIFHQGRGEFEFIPGPVFSHFLLADEINRTSPRIQSALLECMNERQVTIDGRTRELGHPFMVVATQNNIDDAGTFPLPLAQLDRFLLSVEMGVPAVADQARIVRLHADKGGAPKPDHAADPEAIRAAQAECRAVKVSDDICSYIARICDATRQRPALAPGASPRASLAILRAAQANAFLGGNPAVYPEDVKAVAPAALRHRIGAGGTAQVAEAVGQLLEEVAAP
ncbi:MAG: MoxR family ATPase [Verrucomicrobiales bacterium]